MGAAEALKVDAENFKIEFCGPIAPVYGVQEYLKSVLPELPEFTAMCVFKD